MGSEFPFPFSIGHGGKAGFRPELNAKHIANASGLGIFRMLFGDSALRSKKNENRKANQDSERNDKAKIQTKMQKQAQDPYKKVQSKIQAEEAEANTRSLEKRQGQKPNVNV